MRKLFVGAIGTVPTGIEPRTILARCALCLDFFPVKKVRILHLVPRFSRQLPCRSITGPLAVCEHWSQGGHWSTPLTAITDVRIAIIIQESGDPMTGCPSLTGPKLMPSSQQVDTYCAPPLIFLVPKSCRPDRKRKPQSQNFRSSSTRATFF